MGKLEGKVALVTGSGRNIGRATVLKLAGEGAHVVVNARSNQQEAETVAREARDLGVKAVPILADVGKKAEVEALAARALSEFGRVDILINNAAIRPHKPFTETTDTDWELMTTADTVPTAINSKGKIRARPFLIFAACSGRSLPGWATWCSGAGSLGDDDSSDWTR